MKTAPLEELILSYAVDDIIFDLISEVSKLLFQFYRSNYNSFFSQLLEAAQKAPFISLYDILCFHRIQDGQTEDIDLKVITDIKAFQEEVLNGCEYNVTTS